MGWTNKPTPGLYWFYEVGVGYTVVEVSYENLEEEEEKRGRLEYWMIGMDISYLVDEDTYFWPLTEKPPETKPPGIEDKE